MVKKKVSKKKTSSSGNRIKKRVTHSKPAVPAVEQLNVAPVQQANVLVQNETLNISPPVERINVQPAPIYVNEVAETPKAEVDNSRAVKILAIAICCIVMLFWIAIAILSIEINSGPKIITRNVSVTTYAYTTVSLDRLLNITDIKYSENVSQLGYLREEITDNGFIKRYAVDDKGNRVELLIGSYSKDKEFEKLFIPDNTTRQLYNITGTFRFKMNAFVIEVDNITNSTKDIISTSAWRMENLTTDDKRGVTIDIARGVSKIVAFIYK